MRRLLISLALCAILPCAQAEMSGDDYASGSVIRSDAERAELRARIEAARLREADAAEQRVQAQVAALVERLAREDAVRSPGERLVHRHCQPCHSAEMLAAQRYSRIGWAWVVLRMRIWNGAPIPFVDLPAIIGHLATTQRAGGLTEGLAIVAVLLPAIVLAGFLRRRIGF